MDENYYIALSNFEEMIKAESYATDEYYRLQTDGYRSWCSEDPELDKLRRGAMRALEDYRDAVHKRSDKINDQIVEKMFKSDKVLNLRNLFK